MNSKYVYDKTYEGKQLKHKMYDKYETIILKSDTGTGKTTAIANHQLKYGTKFLSITDRESLSKQHVESFRAIDMKFYKDVDGMSCNSYTCCINSLCKQFNDIEDELTQYTLYFDEINSFLQNFTHNETLDSQLKNVYKLLVGMVKHANKVIVGDAVISDAVFLFLKYRDNGNKMYINNEYKKYDSIHAIRIRDGQMLLHELYKHIDNKQYFLFGCDSAEKFTEMYNLCCKTFEADKLDCILITGASNFQLQNANVQFKQKYVFYSPKITYGIDFNDINYEEDVFIYIKGHTIQPSMHFQQATRCRNMKQLFYYGEVESKESIYDSVEDVKNNYEKCIQINKHITNICESIDADDNSVILENMFFNLFCYNEYVKDTFETNKLLHFEHILRNEGFVLSAVGDKNKLEKDVIKEAEEIQDEYNEELFNEFVGSSKDKRSDVKFFKLAENIDALSLTGVNKETLNKYKHILVDKNKVDEYFQLVACMRDDEYVDAKLSKAYHDMYDVRVLKNTYNKIKFLRTVENRYDIKPFDIEASSRDKEMVQFDDDMYTLFQKLFRSNKQNKLKPSCYKDVRLMYIQMIKNIISKDIIWSKQVRTGRNNSDKEFVYWMNKDKINEYLDIYKRYDKCFVSFKPCYLQMFNVEAVAEDAHLFVDDGLDDEVFV
jgi:hypothetical protein